MIANTYLLATIMLILLVAAPLVALHAAAEEGGPSQYYPCIKCHATLKPTGLTNFSEFHGIKLEGKHSSLVCSNCHIPDSGMMKLRGNVSIAIPGLSDESSLFETNKLCAECHADIYESYLIGAHGNMTFTCEGGNTSIVYGYKGVKYYYHDCPRNATYTPVQNKPCIACHNPHSPHFKPVSILPPPSDRPEPPKQDYIVYAGIPVVISGVILIALAPILHRRGLRGGSS